MIKHFLTIYSLIITQSKTSNNNPARLHKQEKKTSFETLCRKACPYVILACVIIIMVLLFLALVKYGHAFSTEANNYEHLHQIVSFYGGQV